MKFTIYAADRSGNSWTVLECRSPGVTLGYLERVREVHPNRAYGVYLTDNPERGNVETDLEELVYQDEVWP